MIVREIGYRKINFAMGVVSVGVAVGCCVGLLTLLAGHERRTERIVEEKRAAVDAMMRSMEDDYRKITLRMGFNMAIVRRDQTVAGFYGEGEPKTMPEAYAGLLATKKVSTINHVTPVLQQKVEWPEQKRTILLTGTRGVIHIQDPRRQKPLMAPVARGTMAVGYELHRELELKVGQKVTLMGREFEIRELKAGRGSVEDVGVWINLDEAQEMLDKKGLITAILALECECSEGRLAIIRKEVGSILPETQVIEFSTLASARAEARTRAAKLADEAALQEKAGRERLQQERRGFAKVLIPVVLIGCAVWIGLLTLGNVRERGAEIGILRAIGLRGSQVLGIFLGKAVVMGLVGGGVGYAVGVMVGRIWQEQAGDAVVRPLWLGGAIVGALALCMVASGPPALMAARQDPAEKLREE